MTTSIFSRTLSFLLLCLLALAGRAQTLTQTLRGTVTDASQGRPLAGASVQLLNANTGTITDEQGRFRLTNVPVGRQQLSVSFVGYEPMIINEVLVESGKEQVLDIQLQPGVQQLGEATAIGTRTDRTISAEYITTEQVLRFPASYLDPARLATAYAGVVNAYDGTNNISVRGNSPNSLIWRLEGVEIVNPNHQSNAGTIGDRPTAAGGGVNMLSAQLLGTTRFLTGAFTAEYGNTVGGVMDMSLRPGNNERHEFIAQAGLIGLDLAAEGPISKQKGSSYLVNYRYSFTGLLGAMGVSFGGEDIRFQDLSFNLTFPNRKGGRLTVFGVAGNSSNDFVAKATEEQEEDKDRNNISFTTRMAAGGLTLTQPLGTRLLWKTALVLSANNSSREQSFPGDTRFRANYENDDQNGTRYTLTTSLNYRINARNSLKAGIYVTRAENSLELWRADRPMLISSSITPLFTSSLAGWMIQPYVNYQWLPADNLTVNAGLFYNSFMYNKSQSLEPRASVRWELLPGKAVTLAYGLHSQQQLPQVYLSNNRKPTTPGGLLYDNKSLGFTKAHHLVLGYTHQFGPDSYGKIEAYSQMLFDVPVSQLPGRTFSALNVMEAYVNEPLVNAGKGRNRGIELTFQKYLAKTYYLLASGSVYDSQYQATDGIWRDTRFNGKFTSNLTAGKEWTRSRENRSRIWGLNGRLTYAGGFRDRTIDLTASRQLSTTVYTSDDFNVQLPAYFRTDVRIYWKKSKTRYSRTLSLDLQNLTGAQNAAYSYFDAYQGKVVKKYQLGLIPILNYRWEF
ncbi:outer membrane receptor protein involved in Fe transport [Larkinella arboricola]|uniref:Outer membrane receptor protein involved in Fe transport n=1 Tax=Larkinella arboricola TaxID=643671 RepID=A0A327X0Y8_LARAB|nr:TonB-dependent receptor [Larkinella arboricola]RAK00141.1 outer membrane receptor protein involved in Fe transport [Larkinella arboricola]